METTAPPQVTTIADEPSLSLGSRFLAMFARPARAWAGLERKGQWWFPLLISVVVTMSGMALTYQRAVVPMTLERMQRQVDSGQVPPGSVAHFEQQMRSPVATAMNVGSAIIIIPLVTLATALLPWLAAGFLLGHKFRYRDAFVVTSWAGVVALPAQILSYALAWINGTMANLHVGFGILLPVEETPSKLMTGLGAFLDQGIGPFSIWYVAVMALGAAALSGAPPRRVLTTLGILWVVVWIIFAALAALFTPGV